MVAADSFDCLSFHLIFVHREPERLVQEKRLIVPVRRPLLWVVSAHESDRLFISHVFYDLVFEYIGTVVGTRQACQKMEARASEKETAVADLQACNETSENFW